MVLILVWVNKCSNPTLSLIHLLFWHSYKITADLWNWLARNVTVKKTEWLQKYDRYLRSTRAEKLSFYTVPVHKQMYLRVKKGDFSSTELSVVCCSPAEHFHPQGKESKLLLRFMFSACLPQRLCDKQNVSPLMICQHVTCRQTLGCISSPSSLISSHSN